MKVVIKGGIIKCDNRLFQNSNLVAGAIGYLDLVYLKFRPIGQEECHVYDVVELNTLSSIIFFKLWFNSCRSHIQKSVGILSIAYVA